MDTFFVHLQTVFMPGLMIFVLFFRDVRPFASCRMIVPFLRDEKFGIDEDVFLSCDVGHKGSDLPVVNFAESSEPLPRDTCGLFAVFLEAARIENENTVVFADFRCDLLGKELEHRLVIPIGLTDESLEGLPVLFEAIGDGLNIFSREIGKETFKEKLCVLSCFTTSEVFKKRLPELLKPPDTSA